MIRNLSWHENEYLLSQLAPDGGKKNGNLCIFIRSVCYNYHLLLRVEVVVVKVGVNIILKNNYYLRKYLQIDSFNETESYAEGLVIMDTLKVLKTFNSSFNYRSTFD